MSWFSCSSLILTSFFGASGFERLKRKVELSVSLLCTVHWDVFTHTRAHTRCNLIRDVLLCLLMNYSDPQRLGHRLNVRRLHRHGHSDGKPSLSSHRADTVGWGLGDGVGAREYQQTENLSLIKTRNGLLENVTKKVGTYNNKKFWSLKKKGASHLPVWWQNSLLNEVTWSHDMEAIKGLFHKTKQLEM